MIPFSLYKRVKDRYCVAYFGSCDEYIVQLLQLRPMIENQLKGLQLYISCRDDVLGSLSPHERVIPLSQIDTWKTKLGHIRELRCNMVSHPIQDFFEEPGLKYTPANVATPDPTTICAIVPKGTAPTKNLTADQLQKLKGIAQAAGFTPQVTNIPINAGWVMGVESLPLFLAAYQGIRTCLVPTGLGTDLYRKMYPKAEVLKNI